MPVKLFRDKGAPLTHRELDQNFEMIKDMDEQVSGFAETLDTFESVPVIGDGPTLARSLEIVTIPDTIKLQGMIGQSGDNISYCLATDTQQLYRKGGNEGLLQVSDEGIRERFIFTDAYTNPVMTPNGKYVIRVRRSYDIYITNTETAVTTRYGLNSYWSSTYINNANTVMFKDNKIYILANYSSNYYIVTFNFDQETGSFSAHSRITHTGRTQRGYYNVVGVNTLVAANAGDQAWKYNVTTGQFVTISTPIAGGPNGSNFAYMPIAVDENEKVHFIQFNWSTGMVQDLSNIYIENDSGGITAHPVSARTGDELGRFGEGYSYNWPYMHFQALELENRVIYASAMSSYDQVPLVVYNPETLELSTATNSSEAIFVKKGV